MTEAVDRDEWPLLERELGIVSKHLDRVRAGGLEAFDRDGEGYGLAVFAVIRLQSILEDRRFADYLQDVSGLERSAIRTTRDIAAHAGYSGTRDVEFWISVTERIPEVIGRILAGRGVE